MRTFAKVALISLVIIQTTSHADGERNQYKTSPLINRDPLEILKNIPHNVEINDSMLEDVGLFLKKLRHEMMQLQFLDDLSSVGNTTAPINAICLQSLKTMVTDVSTESYAKSMIDSWGKLESGLLQANLRWEGRYYECRSSHKKVNDSVAFSGKFCALNINLGLVPPGLQFLGVPSGISTAMCVPDSCSDYDLDYLIYALPYMLNVSLPVVVYAQCAPEPSTWEAKSVMALITTIFFILLVLIGTGMGSYKYYKRNRAHHEAPLIQDENKEPEETKIEKLFASFALHKNTEAFLKTDKQEGNIHCLHGLRFISMTWVILGHSFLFPLMATDNIRDFSHFVTENPSFMAILSGTFSVDSFFFLSGLLVAFLGLREITKTSGKINVPLMYFGRYLRLTPAYAYLIFYYVSLYLMMGDGAYWGGTTYQIEHSCGKYWWTNLLYINNIYPATLGEECFAWGWYLANDMQFYLLAPLFIILLYRKPRAGVISLAVGTLISITITGALSAYYGLQPPPIQYGTIANAVNGKLPNSTFVPKGNATGSQADKVGSDIYAKPWCRISVYFIGMITGYILHATKGKLKMNKFIVAGGWLATAIMELALVYGPYRFVRDGEQMSNNAAAFYNAVSRPLWSVGLAWVVIACVCGYGGPVDRFLSWKAFIPLSRLTYCCYLVHPMVLTYVYNTQETDIHFSVMLFTCYYLAILVLTHGIAYSISMLVEAPMLGIQKIILPKKQASSNERRQQNSTNHLPVNSRNSEGESTA